MSPPASRKRDGPWRGASGHRHARPADLGDALDTLTTLGPGRVDKDIVDEAAELRLRIHERLARGNGLTVAALAGGTGVGKSALFNALTGLPIAREGVRRPTTSVPSAAVADLDSDVSNLLDWLEVPERHEVGHGLPAGLVLLDLPDHDSVAEDHRRTAERFAQRVDVVVWVVDPLKYARDDTHQGPLAQLTEHADVLLVVLNRADELTPGDLAACRADLVRRLEDGGHDGATVSTTSARTGQGVAELRSALTGLARTHSAATARLAGDAAVLGRRAAARLDAPPGREPAVDDVLDEVMVAVDGHRAVAESVGLYRREASRGTRSPLARVLGRPFRLAAGTTRRGRSPLASRPAPREVTVDGIRGALQGALNVTGTSGHTHASLDRAAASAAQAAAPALSDAVAGAGQVPAARRWWSGMAGLRLLAELAAFVGAGWLAALAAVDWLRLPALPIPDAVGELSWPTALLLGGLLVRVLLGLVSRGISRIGARRHAARVRRRITRRVSVVIERDLLGPTHAEIDAHRRLREAVTALAGTVT